MEWQESTTNRIDLVMNTETEPAVLSDRFHYLCPTRYFHFYLFYERRMNRTCWMPEGFRQ